jgi:hypothetical protein
MGHYGKINKEGNTMLRRVRRLKSKMSVIVCTGIFNEDTEVCELGCEERHIFNVKSIAKWMKRAPNCPDF